MTYINNRGNAVIMSMMLVGVISALIGTSLEMSDLSSNQARKDNLDAQYTALGSYIASLGTDSLLCSRTLRFAGPFDLGPVTDEGQEMRVRLPIQGMANEYPAASEEQNRLSAFGGVEFTRLYFRNWAYSKPTGDLATDMLPEFQGDLVLYGKEGIETSTGTNRSGFRKTIARLIVRIDRANPSRPLVSCSTALTDEQYCLSLGGTYSPPSAVNQGKSLCQFKAPDLSCPNPDQYIREVNADGTPNCVTLTACGEVGGVQTFATGMSPNGLVCAVPPTPTPPVLCPAQAIWSWLANCSGTLAVVAAPVGTTTGAISNINGGYSGNATFTCNASGIWQLNAGSTCVASATPPTITPEPPTVTPPEDPPTVIPVTITPPPPIPTGPLQWTLLYEFIQYGSFDDTNSVYCGTLGTACSSPNFYSSPIAGTACSINGAGCGTQFDCESAPNGMQANRDYRARVYRCMPQPVATEPGLYWQRKGDIFWNTPNKDNPPTHALCPTPVMQHGCTQDGVPSECPVTGMPCSSAGALCDRPGYTGSNGNVKHYDVYECVSNYPSIGSCGPAAALVTATAPTTDLCYIGTPTTVTDYGTVFRWYCDGASGRSPACSARKPTCPATTIGNCILGATPYGMTTTGLCAAPDGGSCSHTCNGGVWGAPSTNSCTFCDGDLGCICSSGWGPATFPLECCMFSAGFDPYNTSQPGYYDVYYACMGF